MKNVRIVMILALCVALLVMGCQQAAPAQPPAAPPKPAEPAAKPTAPAAAPKPAAPAATAVAPKPAAPASAVVKGGTLRIGVDDEPAVLDPHVGTTVQTDRQMHAAIYDGLTALDKDLKVVPDLALSWETPNNLTYVFKLRQGVKFHDGTDFNAQAVKFNFDRILDPANNSPQRSALQDVKSVDVVDEHTVRLNLKQPSAALLSVLTDRPGKMVSPSAVQKLGKDFGRNPVGTGAFQFVEWRKDDHITVKKFAGYWNKDLPHVDQVIYKAFPDRGVKLTNLKTGNLDIVDQIEPKDMASVRASTDLKASEAPGLGYNTIFLHNNKAPFNKKELRQAVALSIDREAIQKAIFFGLGRPGVSPISISSWAFDTNWKGYTRDLAKAKVKLAEGGQPNGFKFPFSVYNNPLDIQHAQVIKAQLAEAGIEADIQVGERARLLADMRAGNHVAVLSGWSGRADADEDVSYHYHSKGGNNSYLGNYKNPQLDELIEKARATSNLDQRKSFYSQIQQIIYDDSPNIILIVPRFPEVKAMGRKVQGFVHIPDGIISPRTIWIEK